MTTSLFELEPGDSFRRSQPLRRRPQGENGQQKLRCGASLFGQPH